MITNMNYYDNTNALVRKYREYVGDYGDDLSKALQEAQFLKERYENAFAENPGIIAKYVKAIDSDYEYVVTSLYNIFVEEIPDYLELSLRSYASRRTPEELERLTDRVYEEKIVASDPIPLFVQTA